MSCMYSYIYVCCVCMAGVKGIFPLMVYVWGGAYGCMGKSINTLIIKGLWVYCNMGVTECEFMETRPAQSNKKTNRILYDSILFILNPL